MIADEVRAGKTACPRDLRERSSMYCLHFARRVSDGTGYSNAVLLLLPLVVKVHSSGPTPTRDQPGSTIYRSTNR